MKKFANYCIALIFLLGFIACQENKPSRFHAKLPILNGDTLHEDQPYQVAVDYLGQHVPIIQLRDSTGDAGIALAPKWNARVLTSSLLQGGDSYGWLHFDLVAQLMPQSYNSNWGGEDQVNLLFQKIPGDTGVHSLDNLHGFEATGLDTASFRLIHQSKSEISLEKTLNFLQDDSIATALKLKRNLRIIARRDVSNFLGIDIPRAVKAVAFESENILTNTGEHRWDTAHGSISMRVKGMFPIDSPMVALIPLNKKFKSLKEVESLIKWDGDTFPGCRLINNRILAFPLGDSLASRIQVPFSAAMNFIGIYNGNLQTLTIIQFSKAPRSGWYFPLQYDGDQFMVDGPILTLKNSGKIEDSISTRPYLAVTTYAPIQQLGKGKSAWHYHRTIHLNGNRRQLSNLLQGLFNARLKELEDKTGE
ncbi:hypothetical protein COR50_11305 [Chitinophaga caeni]|uniref:Uncharacterized protein n=1 Tax=Chitinophaga caeni TaxID=2029983 RepID=A0A291QUU1_9BACT|nr:DUF6786 family protein [Chitinophaga caeni]ATL47706.1 hypothetical protein COR50_11305 [Chitinophaga caeni]